MIKLHGKNIIAGKPVASANHTFRAASPCSGDLMEPDFYNATAQSEIEQAFAEAKAASRALSRDHLLRARFLDEIAREIENAGDDLIERCSAETALPAQRLQGERARTTNQLRMFAELLREGTLSSAEVDPADENRKPLPKPELQRMLVPVGPVVVFGASNFPLAFSVAGGDTAAAFAAGCPVVFKAHPAHPGTCEIVAEAIVRACQTTGVPAGVFSLLHGGPELGQQLVQHPAAKAVAFTGSPKAGRALHDAVSSRAEPIPLFAEMGSINPFFILPGALKERPEAIAETLAQSIILGSGQFCTKPGLILTTNSPGLAAFEKKLIQCMTEAKPAPMLTKAIATAYADATRHIKSIPGVDLYAGPTAESNADAACTAVLGRTSDKVFAKNTCLSEEVFGPFALLVVCEGETCDSLCSMAEGLSGQLTATIQAEESDFDALDTLLPILEEKAGRLVYNGVPTGVEVSRAMQHGGPYPASSDARFTSVGTAAVERFLRPVCYQNFPQQLLKATTNIK